MFPAIIFISMLFLAGVSASPVQMIRLTDTDYPEYLFRDDTDTESMLRALTVSLQHIQPVSLDKITLYDRQYTTMELQKSLLLFQEILLHEKPEQQADLIKNRFNVFKLGNDSVFTAYYDYPLPGSSVKTRFFNAPVYAIPGDLVTSQTLARGKYKKNILVSYDTAENIVLHNSLKNRAEVLFFANLGDLLLAQIEGGAAVTLQSGEKFHITYASDNGHPFKKVSELLVGKCELSAPAIRSYLVNHPRTTRNLLKNLPRYVFFKKTKASLGNRDTPLVAQRSIAMDQSIIPFGTIVFFKTSGREKLQRFGFVHDSGAAIKGSAIDLYRGENLESGQKFRENGELFIIVAKPEFLVE